jgi:aspartyl protease family protein
MKNRNHQILQNQMKHLAILGVILFFSFGFAACSGCSKSGSESRYVYHKSQVPEISTENKADSTGNIVKMIKQDGVYHIPVSINGVSLYFIFDTGAGYISISASEAESLYQQGKLAQEDVVGRARLMNADGDISQGTMIILREVQIGNRILHDVKATVMANLNAPLLMGQSALEQFGRISIDYEKGEISFE